MAGIPGVQLPLWSSLRPGDDVSLVDAGDESGPVRELDESRLERGDASPAADADASPASTRDGRWRCGEDSRAGASLAGEDDASVLQERDTSGAESGPTHGRRCLNGACARSMVGLRKDARYCSVGCRQAAWRFRGHVGRAAVAAVAKRLGFADPPYPGLADYYVDHPDYAGEVDHRELLERLGRDYDGWLLCTSSDALPVLLGICATLGLRPRVAAWLRGSRRHATRGPVRAWEPVLYVPARDVVADDWPDDALSHVSRPRISDPARVIGAKPPAFSDWAFRLMGARAGDVLDDLFPGSGGVGRAWAIFNGESS